MQDAKRRAILFLAVALFLSAIAGYLFMQKISAVDESLGDFASVYVANKNIKARQPLLPNDFDVVKVPRQYIQQSVVTNIQGIKLENGIFPITQLVSVVPLQKGDLLTHNMLKSDTTLSSENKRMVMLNSSNKVGFDDVFSYNDRVDIIVTLPQSGTSKTVVYLQKIPVVALAKDAKGNVTGLGLEMTLNEAADFIDKQVNAINIRVLKAPNAEEIKGTKNNADAAKKLHDQVNLQPSQTDGTPQDDIAE